MSLDPVWTSRHTWRSGHRVVCTYLRACVCVCVVSKSGGDQVFSSDRLKPLKENQWCHKRKVSSSLPGPRPLLPSSAPHPPLSSPPSASHPLLSFSPSPFLFTLSPSCRLARGHSFPHSPLFSSSSFPPHLSACPRTPARRGEAAGCLAGQDGGCMCDAWINPWGYPGKKGAISDRSDPGSALINLKGTGVVCPDKRNDPKPGPINSEGSAWLGLTTCCMLFCCVLFFLLEVLFTQNPIRLCFPVNLSCPSVIYY